MLANQNIQGFPFELEEELGRGGYASVYRGTFHQGHAAFKFVPIKCEQDYGYNLNSIGCHEYYKQETVMKQL